MAHFAELDENNVVLRVVVIAESDCQDENGNESDAVGQNFCRALFNSDKTWLRTSYNGNIRAVFAGVGSTYDPDNDYFVPPRPFASFVFDYDMHDWTTPTPKPEAPDGEEIYIWNEDKWENEAGQDDQTGWCYWDDDTYGIEVSDSDRWVSP